MQLKQIEESWVVHTFDLDYDMDNFYTFANGSDVKRFLEGEIVTGYYGRDIKRSKHEIIQNIKHTVNYAAAEEMPSFKTPVFGERVR